MVSVMVVMYLFEAVEHRLTALWCRPWSKKSKRGLRWRIQMALSRNRLPMYVPWFLGLLNPFYLFAFAHGPSQDVALGCLAGYVGLSLMLYPAYLGKRLRQFREQFMLYAAEKLAKTEEPAFAEPILLRAGGSRQEVLRLAATVGLKEIGTGAAEEMLGRLCGDRNTRVSIAAMQAYKGLLKVLKGQKVLSLAPLAQLLVEFEREKKSSRYRLGWDNLKRFPKLAAISTEIDRIVYSQLWLRQGFPHVFCEKCHVFAELKAFDDWRWVTCPVCHDATDLRSGIEKVVGTIGAAQDWDLREGVLYISLWDRNVNRAIYAEVEGLEIHNDPTMDLDWAVSAVLEMLHNKHLRGKGRISIRFIGVPKLGINARHILKRFAEELPEVAEAVVHSTPK